jgi:hypothetical protein
VLFVPYQRGDSGVSKVLSNLQRSKASLILEVDVTARSKELFRDGFMSFGKRDLEGGDQIVLRLDIDVAACCNKLLRDARMPFASRDEDRRDPLESIHGKSLNLDITSRCDELLRDSRMPIFSCQEDRCGPTFCQEIHATASINELFQDGCIAVQGCGVEGRC